MLHLPKALAQLSISIVFIHFLHLASKMPLSCFPSVLAGCFLIQRRPTQCPLACTLAATAWPLCAVFSTLFFKNTALKSIIGEKKYTKTTWEIQVCLHAIIFFYGDIPSMGLGELEIFRVYTHTHTHDLFSTRGTEWEVNTQFLLTIMRIVWVCLHSQHWKFTP